MIRLVLHVGDTFNYKGVTYKAERAQIKNTRFGKVPQCDGCSFAKEWKRCTRPLDMPLCTRDYSTPLIFVKQINN